MSTLLQGEAKKVGLYNLGVNGLPGRKKCFLKGHLSPSLWLSEDCNNGPNKFRIFLGISHWDKNRLKSFEIREEDLVSWRFTICQIVRETWSWDIGGQDHTLTRLLSYSHLCPYIQTLLHVRTPKMGLDGGMDHWVFLSNVSTVNTFFSSCFSLLFWLF